MSSFLSSKLVKNSNPYINAPYGFGKVIGTGRINTSVLLKEYRKYLQSKKLLIPERFEYDQLQEKENEIIYKDISAKNIVFAEGPSVISNPFFPQPPFEIGKELLIGNKGEYIIVKAPVLKLKAMLKSSLFVIPQGNDLYKVGATYSREDYTYHNTQKAENALKTKISKIINCSFEVIDQVVGVRPQREIEDHY